jgi:6-phosphofructokinase 1
MDTVYGTDYRIGFSTATRSVISSTTYEPVQAHERIEAELFGRNSGETSLISAYPSGAIKLTEVPFDVEKLSRMLVEDKKSNPSNYAMVTISEGASMIGGQTVEYGQEDAYGHRKLGGTGMVLSDAVKRLTGSHIIYQQLSYLMRSGAPDSLDLMVAFNYANMAMDLIAEGCRAGCCASGRQVYHIPSARSCTGRSVSTW